jgi:hypothetical protein
MPTQAMTIAKLLAKRAIMIAAFAALIFQTAAGQSNSSKASVSAKTIAAGGADDATGPNTSEVAKTLKVAAEALGLARWSGVGGQRLPEVDVINTMEIWGSGTTYGLGQPYKAGEPWPVFKTEFHAALGYNPPAMRVEMTRTSSGASSSAGAAPQHTIEVVRDKYAWDESEIGAGLVPGKGTATPAMAAAGYRLLQLWILPYGVIKSALAAGDKTKISTEKGATVITFPLSGQLSDVTVKATLDAQNEVAKVETRSDNPALADLITETEYSDYADHGEIATDVKSPGHIVRKQGGHPVLDLQVKMLDANNPYLVFPVPDNVKKAVAH